MVGGPSRPVFGVETPFCERLLVQRYIEKNGKSWSAPSSAALGLPVGVDLVPSRGGVYQRLLL